MKVKKKLFEELEFDDFDLDEEDVEFKMKIIECFLLLKKEVGKFF